MEPLTPTFSKTFSFFVSIFYFLAIVPVFISLLMLVPSFDLDFISPLFFKVLMKSFFFASIQALLSVLSLGVFCYLISALFFNKRTHSVVLKTYEASGFLSFSISPSLLSLSLIFISYNFFNVPISGLWAIVLCHFLLNAGYFSSQFLNKSLKTIQTSKRNQLEYLKSIGADVHQQRKMLLWPLFKSDFKSWGPQVFLWCYSSFAPVLLLASSPQQASPELLLYYSLLNDPTGTRVLVLFILGATISLGLNYFVSPSDKNVDPLEVTSRLEGKASNKNLNFFLILMGLLFLFPFIYSAAYPLFSGLSWSQDLTHSILNTLLVFAFSFILSVIFCVLSSLTKKELKHISYFRFLTGPMLLSGVLFLSYKLKLPAILWVVLASFLASAPWIHHKIRYRISQLPPDHFYYCKSIGLKNFSFFSFYLWPTIKPLSFRLSLLVSLWSLGEFTFSKAFLERSSTLSLFIDEKLRRYNIAEASTALSLTLLLSAIVVTPLLWKGRRNAAL